MSSTCTSTCSSGQVQAQKLSSDQAVRITLELFKAHFSATGASDATPQKILVSAPGRSEISGNHTDHEGGHVIAGALNVAITGVCAPNGTQTIRLVSQGFDPVEVDLASLEPREDEKLTTQAIVRGMAYKLASNGFTPQGFDIALTSTVPGGSGLSSSAACEAALGRAMEALWKGEPISAIDLALYSQFAENTYFGKPCGLMDQLSVCLGGLAFMNFEDPAHPQYERLSFNFEDKGYALVLVNVGSDHVQFTHEYAAVPQEMQAVAQAFDKTRLCEVLQADFNGRVVELREKLGDRALLRAIHYWYENNLVDERWRALNENNIDTFLDLTRKSGTSSGMFLQNVSTSGSYQPAMLALGLAEQLLQGAGAIRIHGGGFGGSIQCFVPLDMVDEFIASMNSWFGDGAAMRYAIADKGASAQCL